MSATAAEIAANRFGTGARTGDIAAARRDPRGWLLAQLQPVALDASLGGSDQALRLIAQVRGMAGAAGAKPKKKGKQAAVKPAAAPPASDNKAAVQQLQKLGTTLALDTLLAAVQTDRPFAMRLLDFWSNHFSVSFTNPPMRGLAPTLEREAIAPHVAGRFVDMLLAVEQHPAMLMYLDNAVSTGPASQYGKRSGKGLNENLAREILELHTLGVDGGYQQADVRELAMAITGWTLGALARGEEPGFLFRATVHEPGARTVLGKSYAEGGLEQGETILRSLAAHPSTAHHVCFKLARHMVADEPPPALVDALVARWRASDGDLRAVCEELLRNDAAWEGTQRKLKSPREFVVSAARAVGGPARVGNLLFTALQTMGQAPFSAGSPAGFGDVTSAWDGAEALMTRIDWAQQLGTRSPRGEPLALAREALGAQLSEATTSAMRGAASRAQALALLLMSPEFQRR